MPDQEQDQRLAEIAETITEAMPLARNADGQTSAAVRVPPPHSRMAEEARHRVDQKQHRHTAEELGVIDAGHQQKIAAPKPNGTPDGRRPMVCRQP